MKRLLLILFLNTIVLGGCTKQTASGTMANSVNLSVSNAKSASTPQLSQKADSPRPHPTIYQVRGIGKTIALTFDDGPDHKYTPQILDILRNNHIHATFFLVGERAAKYPDVVKRIVEEGHAIGNHTWDHQDLEKLSSDKIKYEITETDKILDNLTGVTPRLLRAPYGAVNSDVATIAAETGHQLIGWSVDTMDWDGKSVTQIMANVRKEGKPGSIILQHSAGGKNGNLSNTIIALPQIIAFFRNNGYTIVTVPELISQNY